MAEMDSQAEVARSPAARRLHRSEIILGLLILLSAVGIGVTDFSPKQGFWYWAAMVPVFGALSIFTALMRERPESATSTLVVRQQILHWLALLGAVYLVFLLVHAGRMNNEAAGLMVLIALALTAFLSGVYSDWRFCIVGAVLAGIAAGAAFVERVLWMLLIPGMVVLVLGALWWMRRGRQGAT